MEVRTHQASGTNMELFLIEGHMFSDGCFDGSNKYTADANCDGVIVTKTIKLPTAILKRLVEHGGSIHKLP